jgi:hypothetical protein
MLGKAKSQKILDYLYISERRTNQLFEQIKASATKTSILGKEVSLSLGILGVKITENDSGVESNMFSKLQKIEDRLKKFGQVGELEDKSAAYFILDEVNLRYCDWNGGVFFAGKFNECLFGMAGPSENLQHTVLGKVNGVSLQGSNLYTQLEGWGRFLEGSDANPEVQESIIQTDPEDYDGPLSVVRRGANQIIKFDKGYAEHKMKVLAKNYGSGTDTTGKRIVCASPVYVAVYY